ncbi:MAG: cation transporter [Bacteroidota bacterium]
MKTQELKIQGMTCGHCVLSVRKGLSEVPGLAIESLEIGKAVVRYDETRVKAEEIVRAVEATGYSVSS